jgi:hypothetical protein
MITTAPGIFENYQVTPKLEAAEALNRILRGEISAVEAYEKALYGLEDPLESKRLKELHQHHKELATYWQNQIESKGVVSDKDSGPWGAFVKSFVNTAKVFGDSATLSAMIQGEEHGLNEYQNLLKNEFVNEDSKRYARETAIPNLELHINSLKALKKMH